MKRIFAVIAAILLMPTVPLAASASGSGTGLVADEAELFTEAEERKLASEMSDVAAEYGCELIILTVRSLGGYTAEDYAASYYDANGYGYGETRSGALLLVSTGGGAGNRDVYVYAYGDARYALTLPRIDDVLDGMMSDLRSENWYAAAQTFVRGTESGFANPAPSTDYPPENYTPQIIAVSFGLGLLAAGITVGVMWSKMKTVKLSGRAAEYIRQGSLNVTHSGERFLYRRVSRVARPQAASPSGGGGRSGGGGGHGGGRKF
ncbi:MAG: TPM domain-containing protein [Oscillospiraceae bacterium]|jgi:uncharacterized protein|nr:TPM domain-containing protein [Oscillospiraceae bacterium]